MKILFLHGWTSVPGGRKPTYFKDHGHEVINPALPDDDFDESVRIAEAEFQRHKPDVIVGSARGSGNDLPDGIRINSRGELRLFGQTISANFPVSRGAYQSSKGQRVDAVTAKLSNDLNQILYNTFLGGSGNNAGLAGCVDQADSLVVAGASTGPWPLKNAIRSKRTGQGNAVVAKLSKLDK